MIRKFRGYANEIFIVVYCETDKKKPPRQPRRDYFLIAKRYDNSGEYSTILSERWQDIVIVCAYYWYVQIAQKMKSIDINR